MARESFSPREAIADHVAEQEDACSLCGEIGCVAFECDEGPRVDPGWDICYGENPDGTVASLTQVNYLSCLQDTASTPPPRHPAAARLEDLLKYDATPAEG